MPNDPEGIVSEVSKIADQPLGFSLTTNPVTAGFEALAAIFNFLSTPQGQIVVQKILALDDAFEDKIHNIIQKIHDDVMKK